MKRLLIPFLSSCIIFLHTAQSAIAMGSSAQLDIERSGRLIASSYETGNPDKKLFGLHKDYFPKRPSDLIHKTKPISIYTEHALQETNSPTKILTGYKQFKKWLVSVRKNFRFPDNLEVRVMSTCIDGCCRYPLDGGISHNHLYLLQACFYTNENKPYLKSITLHDSD